jgi:hypothetical protein
LICAGPLAAVYLAHVEPPASTLARAYLTRLGINLAPTPVYFTHVALKRLRFEHVLEDPNGVPYKTKVK